MDGANNLWAVDREASASAVIGETVSVNIHLEAVEQPSPA